MNYLLVFGISFITSFIFGIGGLGAAVILIPILVFLGIPFAVARPTGLFTNFVSTFTITAHNLKRGTIELKQALPVLIGAVLSSPVGVYLSTIFPEKIIGIIFTTFLFFAGVMVYIPRKGEERDKVSITLLASIGILAGLISGLLGIGGGGLISPLLITCGISSKRVSSITAFVVVFSSFVAFLSYWHLGKVQWVLTMVTSAGALLGGYLAAFLMHRLKSAHVKKILGLLYFALAIKFLMKFL